MSKVSPQNTAAEEDRKRLVLAWTAMHERFAKYSCQRRLLLVPPSGKIVRCFDACATTSRLLMLARCGILNSSDAYARKWFMDGRPARSKARRKFKGHMTTSWSNARKLVKPADRRVSRGNRP